MCPIYEYKCPNCEVVEEVYMHHQDAQSTIPCNKCDGTMVKQVSAFTKTPRQWRVR